MLDMDRSAKTVEIVYPESALECTSCGGVGYLEEVTGCDDCHGSGEDAEGDFCSHCGGDGETFEDDECWSCNGEGRGEVPARAEEFMQTIQPVMQTIQNQGVGVTVPDGERGRCCGGCIAADAQVGERGGWIGFHEQELEATATGDSIYFSHVLPADDDRRIVLDALSRVGRVEWDGSDGRAILLRW